MTFRARTGIGAWLCLSATLCLAVTVSSRTDPSELGAPVYWTWALTVVQVMALWVAGRGQAWGWMVGSAVQPGWIAYALLTDQPGFIVGCAISTGVQLSAYLRADVGSLESRVHKTRARAQWATASSSRVGRTRDRQPKRRSWLNDVLKMRRPLPLVWLSGS